jgi:ribose transport system substrate-binding protein
VIKLRHYFYNPLFSLCVFLFLLQSEHAQAQLNFERAKEAVESAIRVDPVWRGPTTGPKAASGMNIIYIASDLRNGGVNGVAKGMTEAVTHLDWNLRLLDGGGSETRQAAALNRAISFRPDGIVLGGIDAYRHKETLQAAKQLGIKVIGWHSTNDPAGDEELGLFTNITTDAKSVGEIAAQLAIVESDRTARVVIFTDPNYSIAMLKANSMAEQISDCSGCKLLAIEHVSLDKTSDLMPDVVGRLLNEFPEGITHFLVINDLYIDYATPSLQASGLTESQLPHSISAGDGSMAAYKRIEQGKFQRATVPEPLFLQGWQIIDEFNRAFHGLPSSGFHPAVHLITDSNMGEIDRYSGVYEPKNGYRDAYLEIWK